MLTRQDAVLVRSLASCARHAPAKMRAEHMAEKAEDLAKRIEHHADLTDDVRAAFNEPTKGRS